MLRVFLFILSIFSVVVSAERYSSGYYDCQSYIDRYPDLAKAYGNDCSDPVTRDAAWSHWVEYGVEEGRDASPEFDLKPKPKPKGSFMGKFGWGFRPRYSKKDIRTGYSYKDISYDKMDPKQRQTDWKIGPRYSYKDISYDKMDAESMEIDAQSLESSD